MDPVDDETNRQLLLRQRYSDDSRIARTQRRHGVKQMCHTGCAIRDSLHDNRSGRFAVANRNPHARGGKRPNKACRYTLRRQRDDRPADTAKLTQVLKIARTGLCDTIRPMNTRPPRADERAFKMQAEDSISATNRVGRGYGGPHLFACVGDQSWKAGCRAIPTMRAGYAAHPFDGRLIVEKNAAAAIDLHIDEARSQDRAGRKTSLRPILGCLAPRPKPEDAPVPNQHRSIGMPAATIKDTVGENGMPD